MESTWGTKRPEGPERREVSQAFDRLQKDWGRNELGWTFTHYILGVSAIILAVLAGSDDLVGVIADQTTITILTLASGALAGILTFLTPASRRKGYTEAGDLLRITRMRYESEEKYTDKDLNDAVEQAQEVIRRR